MAHCFPIQGTSLGDHVYNEQSESVDLSHIIGRLRSHANNCIADHLCCDWRERNCTDGARWLTQEQPGICEFAETAGSYTGANEGGISSPWAIPFPKSNPYSVEKASLGKKLYFDTRLSAANLLSCGSCHSPAYGWGDGQPTGVGHGMKKLGRRSPTIINAAFGQIFMWDGRAATLRGATFTFNPGRRRTRSSHRQADRKAESD